MTAAILWFFLLANIVSASVSVHQRSWAMAAFSTFAYFTTALTMLMLTVEGVL